MKDYLLSDSVHTLLMLLEKDFSCYYFGNEWKYLSKAQSVTILCSRSTNRLLIKPLIKKKKAIHKLFNGNFHISNFQQSKRETKQSVGSNYFNKELLIMLHKIVSREMQTHDTLF